MNNEHISYIYLYFINYFTLVAYFTIKFTNFSLLAIIFFPRIKNILWINTFQFRDNCLTISTIS